MYIPKHFKDHDLERQLGHIEHARLGTLVTSGEHGLQATPLPLLLRRDEGEFGTLYGHLAKGNPHWKDLACANEALVIFPGADAYVSPAFYPAKAEHGKVVPTWNYVAVHVYGKAEVFSDSGRLLQLVSDLTDRHEAKRPQPWAVSDAPADYIDKMLGAIVGFALPIARLEGKRKLSQNRDERDIDGVRKGLAASHDPLDQHIARLMGDTENPHA